MSAKPPVPYHFGHNRLIDEILQNQPNIIIPIGKSPEFAEGVKAAQAGVKWWINPYPSGSTQAYQWDKGHTAYRTIQ